MTTIKRIQFGSSAWVPRPDPTRATMILIVTCAGFDTGTLIPDLAQYLADHLPGRRSIRTSCRLIQSRLRRSTWTRSRSVSAPCWWRST